jgi:hypothetical protein
MIGEIPKRRFDQTAKEQKRAIDQVVASEVHGRKLKYAKLPMLCLVACWCLATFDKR